MTLVEAQKAADALANHFKLGKEAHNGLRVIAEKPHEFPFCHRLMLMKVRREVPQTAKPVDPKFRVFGLLGILGATSLYMQRNHSWFLPENVADWRTYAAFPFLVAGRWADIASTHRGLHTITLLRHQALSTHAHQFPPGMLEAMIPHPLYFERNPIARNGGLRDWKRARFGGLGMALKESAGVAEYIGVTAPNAWALMSLVGSLSVLAALRNLKIRKEDEKHAPGELAAELSRLQQELEKKGKGE